MRYSVRALRAVQNGQEMFIFFLPAKALKAIPIQVEQFDSSKPYDHPGQGYQRYAEKNRAHRFARYLEAARAVSPTAIMLNDRDCQSKYDPDKGELTFDSEKGPIFNFDGQHRQLGYEFRLEGDESFAQFAIPVVMMRGMDKLTEMMQFQTINSTAKGVATALVNAILANLHAIKGDDAIDASLHRNVVCYKVTEALNNDAASPWYMLIALPNARQWTKREIVEDPTRDYTRVIKANSFVDVLRPVYDYMSMLKMAASLDSRAQEIGAVVNEFWSALKEKMPQAFERPNDYALFKSNGVGPMHLVLRDLMIKMHGGNRKYVKDEFLAMMDGSSLLSDHEFWHSDTEDGARNCSGKGGWPDLAKKIIRDLEGGLQETYRCDIPIPQAASSPLTLPSPVTAVQPPSAVAIASTLPELIRSERFQRHHQTIDRFLVILGWLHSAHSQQFADAVLGFQRGTRLYFAKSEEEILESGEGVSARPIPQSPFWALTTLDNKCKRKVIEDVLRALGYSRGDINLVLAELPDSGIRRDHSRTGLGEA